MKYVKFWLLINLGKLMLVKICACTVPWGTIHNHIGGKKSLDAYCRKGV